MVFVIADIVHVQNQNRVRIHLHRPGPPIAATICQRRTSYTSISGTYTDKWTFLTFGLLLAYYYADSILYEKYYES